MKETLKELKKVFDPHEAERKWYTFWIKNSYFKPADDENKLPFSIVIPPPNVTGSLHMGHALNITLQDILARWKRMKGYRVLWLPGTDHAGIATQNVVEKQLAKEGLGRYRIGRDRFIREVWKWKEKYGSHITHQLKRLGASCDWSRERFTLDEGLSRAVREVFISLFEEGLIYRALRLINWCPRCHTALSDLEVEHEEIAGTLTYVRYPLMDDGHITVATTRPETMLGDTAVAVNPDDKRYAKVVGERVKLPLTDRIIPIIADKEVDPTFGTGAVKVTPSHDFNDEAVAKRQSPTLPFITVIEDDGRMTKDAGKRYAGLDRYECRKIVIEDLKKIDLMEKQENHIHAIGHCYRCKSVIEPLPTVQWYVNVQEMAKDATEVVQEGRINIIPEGWNNSYFSWMKNIKDWCISRQIWWGHQIPAWYCPDCKCDDGTTQGERIYHGFYDEIRGYREGTYKELKDAGFDHDEIIRNSKSIKIGISVKPLCKGFDMEKCPACSSQNMIRDPDVLDTWFSSALWPFSTLGWPDSTAELSTFYPTSVLVTGFDILFFWVARMIMMGLKFMRDVPFKDVYIHALVRDAKGQKMSKSKGNVVDPLLLSDKYGVDAFRFTLTALASQGRDIRFSEDRVEGYRHFVNKLWNALRFLQLSVVNDEWSVEIPDKTFFEENSDILNLPERWILSRLGNTAREINKSLSEYRFNDAASTIYQFIWHEYCDWYIEMSKTSLEKRTNDSIADPSLITLLYVLDNSLRLLHPFMPFVTEEIWHIIPHKGESLSAKPYPDLLKINAKAEKEMQFVIDAVSGIRNIRGELNISPAKKLKASIKTFTFNAKGTLQQNKDYIMNLAKLEILEIGEDVKRLKGSATSVKKDMEIYVPLSGLLDVESELRRLGKELKKIDESISFLNKKLFNEDFLNHAPKHVVEKERSRHGEFISKKERINNNVLKMKELGGDDEQAE